jgi:cardiolipin synthase A/B
VRGLDNVLSWAFAYLALEWILRLAMLVYVPQRRSPAAARTWLLLIFIQPILGGVLYALVGRPTLSRHRTELQNRVSVLLRTRGRESLAKYSGRPTVPEYFAQAVTLAENLGDFPIVQGNTVELLPDYDASIARLIDDIDSARSHVHLLYYIFADDATGNRVADALIRAASRKVECCVLIDSMASKGARRRLEPRLRSAGVEVRELLPFGLFRRNRARLDLRNHRKIAVIDGLTAYVGSQNLVDSDFKKNLVYEEMVARFEGPVVAQLQAVFLSDRFFEAETPERDARFFPAPDESGSSPAQVLPSGPGFPLANNQRLIVALIHAARRRIVITTPYFVPDEALLQSLQTAVLRGVDVHLVLPAQADQILVCLAQRSYYEELLESGIRIHLYGKRFLHAKHVTFDDTLLLIGSSNMDIRSFQLNSEVSVLVYDANVVSQIVCVQDQHIREAALLDQGAWNARGVAERVLQNTARLVDSLL